MRKLAIMAALATTALAAPAMARDGAWYVGAEGGGMIVEDMKFDLTRATKVDNAYNIDSKYGFDVDGVIGYDFGMFRVEGEVGYKRAEADEITTAVTPLLNSASAGGHTDALSFMVNGLLDFGSDDGISGYVGGGAGIARVKSAIIRARANERILLDDTDSKFAWQAIAGVRAPITQNIDVGLKYRFFNVDDVKLVAASDGGTAKGRFRSHSLLASVMYNFGEPAAPPPPPPPVTPPPPPPIEQPAPPPPVAPGPFIVFFDWNKSNITTEAAGILDNAAAAYASSGSASVMLAGHADKSGSDSYNVGLSQRRADSVKAYLAGKGIPDTALSTEAFGESRPLVETADGVREPQNRRVEITYGPGSGR